MFEQPMKGIRFYIKITGGYAVIHAWNCKKKKKKKKGGKKVASRKPALENPEVGALQPFSTPASWIQRGTKKVHEPPA